jgi:hypothetical protein
MKQHLPSPGAFALAALLTCNFAAQGQHIAGQSAGRPSQASAAAQPSPTAPQILKIDPPTGGQRCPNRCCSFAASICRRLRFTLAIPTSRSNRPKSPKTDTGRSSGSTPPPRSQRPSLSPSKHHKEPRFHHTNSSPNTPRKQVLRAFPPPMSCTSS